MSAKMDLSYPKILGLFEAHAAIQRTESRQFLAWFDECIDKLAKVVVRLLEAEVIRRDSDPKSPLITNGSLKARMTSELWRA